MSPEIVRLIVSSTRTVSPVDVTALSFFKHYGLDTEVLGHVA
jgi:hypothetical protein